MAKIDFSSCTTADEFATALQRMLTTGKLSPTDMRAIELICQLRGWTVGKTPKSKPDLIDGDEFGKKTVPVEEPHW